MGVHSNELRFKKNLLQQTSKMVATAWRRCNVCACGKTAAETFAFRVKLDPSYGINGNRRSLDGHQRPNWWCYHGLLLRIYHAILTPCLCAPMSRWAMVAAAGVNIASSASQNVTTITLVVSHEMNHTQSSLYSHWHPLAILVIGSIPGCCHWGVSILDQPGWYDGNC